MLGLGLARPLWAFCILFFACTTLFTAPAARANEAEEAKKKTALCDLILANYIEGTVNLLDKMDSDFAGLRAQIYRSAGTQTSALIARLDKASEEVDAILELTMSANADYLAVVGRVMVLQAEAGAIVSELAIASTMRFLNLEPAAPATILNVGPVNIRSVEEIRDLIPDQKYLLDTEAAPYFLSFEARLVEELSRPRSSERNRSSFLQALKNGFARASGQSGIKILRFGDVEAVELKGNSALRMYGCRNGNVITFYFIGPHLEGGGGHDGVRKRLANLCR